MSTIALRLQAVRARIQHACAQAGRAPDSVSLLAVSKWQGAAAVVEAMAAGQQAFGENYVQEAVQKQDQVRTLAGPGPEWHCIGPLQANKTRVVAERFDWVHTVDRWRIAERLSAQRPPDQPPLQVCVQVNIDGGANKSGVVPDEVLPLAEAVAALPGLRLRGLMAIPEPAPDHASACRVFAQVRALFDELRARGLALDTLSMGMSHDLEAAIASGSTLVRVGTAIFGERQTPGA